MAALAFPLQDFPSPVEAVAVDRSNRETLEPQAPDQAAAVMVEPVLREPTRPLKDRAAAVEDEPRQE